MIWVVPRTSLASVLPSSVDPTSEAFLKNRADLLEQLAVIDELLDEAEAGGGPEATAKGSGARNSPQRGTRGRTPTGRRAKIKFADWIWATPPPRARAAKCYMITLIVGGVTAAFSSVAIFFGHAFALAPGPGHTHVT